MSLFGVELIDSELVVARTRRKLLLAVEQVSAASRKGDVQDSSVTALAA